MRDLSRWLSGSAARGRCRPGEGCLGSGRPRKPLIDGTLANDDRLRHLSAASIGTSSHDIATIGEKDWRRDILHWVATTRDGRWLRCEAGTGSAICSPHLP